MNSDPQAHMDALLDSVQAILKAATGLMAEIEQVRQQLRALEAERDQWIRQAIGHG